MYKGKPQVQLRFPRYWANGRLRDYSYNEMKLQSLWMKHVPIAEHFFSWIEFHATQGETNAVMLMKLQYTPTESGQLEFDTRIDSFERLFTAVNVLITDTNKGMGQAWHTQLFGVGFKLEKAQRYGEVSRSHKVCAFGLQPSPQLVHHRHPRFDLGLVEVQAILRMLCSFLT